MQRAGRFAAHILQAKPAGVLLSSFPLSGLPEPDFGNALNSDCRDFTFASLISLGEALSGIKSRQFAWAVVRLYYSCFYALKAHLGMDKVVIFHHNKAEYICDSTDGYTQEFGRSSHNFKWNRVSNVKRLSHWIYSDVSGEAFSKLRRLREDANYRLPFFDPHSRPEISKAVPISVEKTYRNYKSDNDLFYTFLDDHLVLAFPIKAVTSAAERLKSLGYQFDDQQRTYLARLWPFQENGLW